MIVNRHTLSVSLLCCFVSGICLMLSTIFAINGCDPNVYGSCIGLDVRNLTIQDVYIIPDICTKCIRYSTGQTGTKCAEEKIYICWRAQIIAHNDNFTCVANISRYNNKQEFNRVDSVYQIGSWHYFIKLNDSECKFIFNDMYFIWWIATIISIFIVISAIIVISYILQICTCNCRNSWYNIELFTNSRKRQYSHINA